MQQKSLGKLEQVELRQAWLDEARDFTPWLAREENLDILSVTLGIELELEGIEVPVGPYRADILARDISSDTKVIIENQLEKTNHDHLGKIITYASGLDARVIIWIAREFCEEHRRAIDYLNENASPNLRLFGLEIQLWKIGDSPPAPLFKVISSPNEYVSIIKATERDLTEAQALYLELWSKFKEFSIAKGTFLRLPKPFPQNWLEISIGRSNFLISLTASIQKRRIGCEIYLRGTNAKRAFRQLELHRATVEVQLGPLEWQELPHRQDCRIVRYLTDIDISERSSWENAFDWLKREAESFHKTFSPLIKALPILDNTDDEGDR
jgi:hypothetical protein